MRLLTSAPVVRRTVIEFSIGGFLWDCMVTIGKKRRGVFQE